MRLPLYSPRVASAISPSGSAGKWKAEPAFPLASALDNRLAEVMSLLLLRRRLFFVLHVLLHPLLVLGNDVRYLGFLVRAQQLVNLRRHLGMRNFKLHVR